MRTDALPDVDESSSTGVSVRARTLVVLAGLAAIAVVFLRAYLTPDPPHATSYEFLQYEISRLEWLWVASLWILVVFAADLVVQSPGRVRDAFRRLRRRPVTLAAAVVTFVVFLAGTLGPVVLDPPTVSIPYRNQPPVFTSVRETAVVQCYNPSGDRCYGSWAHPLGTGRFGEDMITLLVFGARNVVQLALVAVMLIVPLATVVGTVSAYVGGRTDWALSGIAESLKAIPALLVFLVWRWVSGEGTLFMLVVSFGLVNWGSVATVVRSRTLDEVSKRYVHAARAAGASPRQVVQWHLLPNVSRTAITTAVYQVPLFITIEATLSFLRFGSPASPLLLAPPSFKSWGTMIGQTISNAGTYWWEPTIPVAALFVTILSVSILSDGISDIVDAQ